jgi:hypothetical protein
VLDALDDLHRGKAIIQLRGPVLQARRIGGPVQELLIDAAQELVRRGEKDAILTKFARSAKTEARRERRAAPSSRGAQRRSFLGVQLFFFGILGEYIAAVHFQVRKRPLVIERGRLNFDQSAQKGVIVPHRTDWQDAPLAA